MMKMLSSLYTPTNTNTVQEAKSAKRIAHDKKKAQTAAASKKKKQSSELSERAKLYRETQKELEGVLTFPKDPNEKSLKDLLQPKRKKPSTKSGRTSGTKKQKLSPKRVVRDRKSLPIKIVVHKDGNVVRHHIDPDKNSDAFDHQPARKKGGFPGGITISKASDKDVLDYFVRSRKEAKQYHPLGPSKGGGAGVVAKVAVKGTDNNEREAIKKHLRHVVQKNKMDPDKKVVDMFVKRSITALHSMDGPNALKKTKHIITPPITAGKDVKRTLVYQVAQGMAKKLNAKYDPEALGFKNFESKKLSYQKRVEAYKKYFSKIDDTLLNFGRHDVLFLDDIMTTGATSQAMHEYFTKFEHKTKAGSKTKGNIINKKDARKPMRGKLRSLVLLKNM